MCTVNMYPLLIMSLFYFFCRRKENAISSLTKANQLVKTIAIGGRINSEGGTKDWLPPYNILHICISDSTVRTSDFLAMFFQNDLFKCSLTKSTLNLLKGTIFSNQMPARFEIDNYLTSEISNLNNSQCKAISEALANPFTLIQGPPGERYFQTFLISIRPLCLIFSPFISNECCAFSQAQEKLLLVSILCTGFSRIFKNILSTIHRRRELFFTVGLQINLWMS